MTKYETLTVIISGIALLLSILIPLSSYIYNKFLKKLEINILPFDFTSLFHNESGSYFRAKFAIECKNKPLTIKTINATIIKEQNNETYKYKWSFLESLFCWISADPNNRAFTTQYATPMTLCNDSITPFIIEFATADETYRNKSTAIIQARDKEITNLKNKAQNIDSYESFVKYVKKQDEYNQLYTKLFDAFIWKEGSYIIEFEIIYDKNKSYKSTFRFQINEEEMKNLQTNIDEIIFNREKELFGINKFFNYVNKTLSED